MSVTFLRRFLEEMIVYVQPNHLLYGMMKNIAHISSKKSSQNITKIGKILYTTCASSIKIFQFFSLFFWYYLY